MHFAETTAHLQKNNAADTPNQPRSSLTVDLCPLTSDL